MLSPKEELLISPDVQTGDENTTTIHPWLPAEIWTLIFESALSEASNLPGTMQPYYKDLLQYRHVSRSWKELLDGSPSFWQWISCTMRRPHLDHVLKRSGTHPVSVCCDDCSRPGAERTCFPGDPRPPTSLSLTKSSHSIRWKSLSVMGPSTVIAPYLSENLPSLETLYIHCTTPPFHTFEGVLFKGATPRLRNLAVRAYKLPWEMMDLGGLRSLVLLGWETASLMAVEQLVRIVDCATRLESLEILGWPGSLNDIPASVPPLGSGSQNSTDLVRRPYIKLVLENLCSDVTYHILRLFRPIPDRAPYVGITIDVPPSSFDVLLTEIGIHITGAISCSESFTIVIGDERTHIFWANTKLCFWYPKPTVDVLAQVIRNCISPCDIGQRASVTELRISRTGDIAHDELASLEADVIVALGEAFPSVNRLICRGPPLRHIFQLFERFISIADQPNRVYSELSELTMQPKWGSNMFLSLISKLEEFLSLNGWAIRKLTWSGGSFDTHNLLA